MAVDAPMTLAIAGNSRRSIWPALALFASDRITAGTRPPLLLNMVIVPSPIMFAFLPITIPHLARIVKDVAHLLATALGGRRRLDSPARPRQDCRLIHTAVGGSDAARSALR